MAVCYFQHALELDPVSEACQRWRDREFSWQIERYGVFRPERYSVEPLDRSTAKEFVVRHHYSGSYVVARREYGLYDHLDPAKPRLAGVATLSMPTSPASLTNVFPALDVGEQSIVLGRFVLLDDVPSNGETWTLAEVFRQAAAEGVRGVLAYSDPVVRVAADGRVVFPGHRGLIYRAANANYLGRTKRRPMTLLPDGSALPERSLQKIRSGERGARHVEERLIAAGATPRGPDQSRRQWTDQALTEVGACMLDHHGQHKFAWAIGPRAQRSRVRIGVTAVPFFA
ncbi:hypothetical protein GCM10022226_61790 [Sphaerisporangium flaviroseum]|uniref:Uncharacterized protein n=1 Tax=Sphaerisporangium flaviroseum TaxID=509199 RepID=A0ABP7J2H7_9ACTN